MDKFQLAIDLIDAYNESDPNQVPHAGLTYSKETLYASRMTEMLSQFAPDASYPLQLAARAQHIGRWEIARSAFPEGRKGYLSWRNTLKSHHAEVCGRLLKQAGYSAEEIDRIQFLVQKKSLKKDVETQQLEDVICLVFLKYYAEDFAQKHPQEKVIEIMRKTWRKMSTRGQQAAHAMTLPTSIHNLLCEI